MTRAPCHHAAAHRHGTRICYESDKCHCDDCSAANASYARRRRKLSQSGRTPGGLIDAEPVREHVRQLGLAGLGYNEIAARSGVARAVVFVLMKGRDGKPPTARVKPTTAARLLAVALPGRPDDLAASTPIDGTGTRRRLRALVAIGWTQEELADGIGWTKENLSRVLHGYGKGLVMVRTHRAVVELYDRLSMTPSAGPWSVRARAVAARHGWPSPLAFDDDSIDDPAARPHIGEAWSPDLDEVAVERAMRGYPTRLRPTERAEATRRLTAAGLSSAQIAERLHVSQRSVVRQRGRAEEVA